MIAVVYTTLLVSSLLVTTFIEKNTPKCYFRSIIAHLMLNYNY
jgi:hypothetical protein